MEINGRTGFFCLIGSPVGHSGSPAMYNYSFQKTEQDYVYLAFDVDLDKTEEAVSYCDHAMQDKGGRAGR